MLAVHKVIGAGRTLANEGNGGVNSDAVKPGIGEAFLFQAREATPDLEEYFLIQIVLVSGIPGVDAADPENSVSILIHQFQEPMFVSGRQNQFGPLTD